MRNKIALLKNLKAKGIGLVDASIVAIYREGKKVPGMGLVLRQSWRSYTKQVVTSAEPEHVIFVGKGVADIVGKDLRELFHNRYSVIPQPNARLSSKEHIENFQKYQAMCNPRP